MKLKKIASLALAGIMAVSMLTACDGKTVDNTPEQPKPQEPTTAGYSEIFQERLGAEADAKITMQDSDDLNDALQAAMKFASDSDIALKYDLWFNTGRISYIGSSNPTALGQVATDLITAADTDRESLNQNSATNTVKLLNPLGSSIAYNKAEADVVMLYVVSGVGTEAAVMEVADDMDSDIDALVMNYNTAGTNGATIENNYHYTGSVSAETITLDADHGKSMTFVAVEIVRHLGR